ncbi:helix-turn-helix domain-containing protein [Streptomyces sp. NPDC006512]|uniref:helix-turn-helix domain-containing protein n=1 Tax=Streptomyces sp. NPDC006512 TaxID=3154307 RepID=UPI00339E3D09
MAPQQVSARSLAPYGVRHSNVRHKNRFTVVGNHLIQNPKMTLTARGLGAYIQSLPAGTGIGIKDLAREVPEGTARIAAALRELEAHGYLKRTVEQLPDGRFVTHTVSYNQPRRVTTTTTPPPPDPQAAAPTPDPTPDPEPDPAPEPDPRPDPEPEAAPQPEQEQQQPHLDPEPGPQDAPEPDPGPEAAPAPDPDPVLLRAAANLLARLRRVDSRLLLGQRDIDRLAPRLVPWLERGATPDAITTALTARLPHPPAHPAGLIAHRLENQLPPLLEPEFVRAAYVPPDPFQTCPACDRAFRSPVPRRCGDCGDPP